MPYKPDTSMTRKERTQQAIDKALEEQNVKQLLEMAVGYECACLGARDGEEHCLCVMNVRQVRNQVSLFALRKGKIVKLNDRT